MEPLEIALSGSKEQLIELRGTERELWGQDEVELEGNRTKKQQQKPKNVSQTKGMSRLECEWELCTVACVKSAAMLPVWQTKEC